MKYSDLQIWQKAMDLVTEVYQVTHSFPAEERFGLATQLQRAAVSIPSNIAEGHGRKATKVFINHLSIANGSLMELETQVQIAKRLGYLETTTVDSILIKTGELGRMLHGWQNSLYGKLNAESRILNPES